MRPFRICGMGVSLIHKLQKQTQQHTQDYAERRRQEEGQGRPAETAGFLLDGDEGGAARPVKNDKHHGAQGRLPGPSGSQEQLSRGSGRQLPSQRRSPGDGHKQHRHHQLIGRKRQEKAEKRRPIHPQQEPWRV